VLNKTDLNGFYKALFGGRMDVFFLSSWVFLDYFGCKQ